MASSPENEMGNQFHCLWEGTICCRGRMWERQYDLSNLKLVFGVFAYAAWLSDQLWSAWLAQYMLRLRSYNYHQSWALQVELVTPLVLQLYFWDHTKSLDDPYIGTWSEITNYHSDFYIGSTFWICSPISHISIIRPLYQLIHDNGQAKCEQDVYHVWISTALDFFILNTYSLSVRKLIPGCQPDDHLLMLQWSIPREMRCCQDRTTMASRDMQGHMMNKSLTNNRYIGVLSTEWTHTNLPLVWPHTLCLGE